MMKAATNHPNITVGKLYKFVLKHSYMKINPRDVVMLVDLEANVDRFANGSTACTLKFLRPDGGISSIYAGGTWFNRSFRKCKATKKRQ
jgi:hypothetical protein